MITINGRGDCSFFVYPDFEKMPEGFKKTENLNLNIAEDLPNVEFTSYIMEHTFDSIENTIVFSEINSSEGGKTFKLDISALFNDFIKSKEHSSVNDCFIKILYEGESARLYSISNGNKKLIVDNFFSGLEYPWEIGLKRFIESDIDFSNLELEIFALTSNDKIYFEKEINFNDGPLCKLNSITFELEWSYDLKFS